MDYNGKKLEVVVVYPQVVDAVIAYRKDKGLPEAPVEELRYGLDEVMEIVNTLDAELLTGRRATFTGLLDSLHRPIDILWVLTHGVAEGWFLNDGLIVASELTSLVRSSGIFLTVLNSCSSYPLAHAVAEELGTALLCTITEVPDRQAFLAGTLFARHLAAGLDYVTAWEKAKPGQKHPYVLIEARGEMNPSDRGRGSAGNPVPGDYAALRSAIAELERVVYGDTRFGAPPLREAFNSLKDRLSAIENSLNQLKNSVSTIEKNQAERNRIFIGMAIILFLLLVTVAYQQFGGS